MRNRSPSPFLPRDERSFIAIGPMPGRWPTIRKIQKSPDESECRHWRALPAQPPGRLAMPPLPGFAGHKGVATLGGWQLGVSRFSQKPDLAWQFVAFMTSAE